MENNRIFIVCGEASGDLHASNLVKALKKTDANFQFEGWGGDRMNAEGVKIHKHIRTLSFMGFWEVLMNLFTILKNFKICKAQILESRAGTVIFVDFPGFNLRMAQWAKANNLKVIYYISPQLWAWKQGRIKQVKAFVDHMYCILPFEKEFYHEHAFEVNYFGHPLLDEIAAYRSTAIKHEKVTKPILALLPGSRMQEVKRKLPLMIEAAKKFEGLQLVVACSNQIPKQFYDNFNDGEIDFQWGKTYEILDNAAFAFVTSGTATLETALFKVPQVVCYKSSFLSYWIAKKVVKIKFISLVNLILGEGLVDELIQGQCTAQNMVFSMRKLIEDQVAREKVMEGYNRLQEMLGGVGASDRIAKSIHETFLH